MLRDRLFALKESLIVRLGGVVPERNPETNEDDRLYQLEEAIADRLALLATGSPSEGLNAVTLGGLDPDYFLDRSNHTGVNDATTLNGQPGSYYLDTNAGTLNGLPGSYYLDRFNHTGANHANTLGGFTLTQILDRANHLGPNDADFLGGYAPGYFAPLAAIAPEVGQVRWLPYSVSGNPWTDSKGFKWYVPNGASIGSGSSGAAIASANMEKLFKALWPDASYTISGGKGLSAAADWSNNKILSIPDMRGRVPVMVGAGRAAAVGDRYGLELVALTSSETPQFQPVIGLRQASATGNNTVIGGTYDLAIGHDNCQPSHALTELWALGV